MKISTKRIILASLLGGVMWSVVMAFIININLDDIGLSFIIGGATGGIFAIILAIVLLILKQKLLKYEEQAPVTDNDKNSIDEKNISSETSHAVKPNLLKLFNFNRYIGFFTSMGAVFLNGLNSIIQYYVYGEVYFFTHGRAGITITIISIALIGIVTLIMGDTLTKELLRKCFKERKWVYVLVVVLVIALVVTIAIFVPSGGNGSSSDDKCPICNGAGMVNDGFLDFKTCPLCKGTGIPPL